MSVSRLERFGINPLIRYFVAFGQQEADLPEDQYDQLVPAECLKKSLYFCLHTPKKL